MYRSICLPCTSTQSSYELVFGYILHFPWVFQARGKEVIRIENFKSATMDDVAAVHSMLYVKGLERVSCIPCFIFKTGLSFSGHQGHQ